MKANKNTAILLIPAIIAFSAIAAMGWRAMKSTTPVVTGLVETTEIDIAAKIPGRIDSLFVGEGDRVHKGQLLARLESKEIEAKVGQARSAMTAARAKYQMALHGARPEQKKAAEQMYLQAKHQFELAQKTYRRVKEVYRDSVVSEQEKDQVEFKYNAARDQLEIARAKYQMVLNGARSEEIEAARALYEQARNAYREALAYLDETELRSPIEGEVSQKIADQEEIIAAGYPILTLFNPEDNYVVLQIREDQMRYIQKGAQFKATIPALGSRKYIFTVTFIAPMADFATWRATNQTGDFDLKTFEVHLRPVKPIPGLRPGMTARVYLK